MLGLLGLSLGYIILEGVIEAWVSLLVGYPLPEGEYKCLRRGMEASVSFPVWDPLIEMTQFSAIEEQQ